LLFRTPAILTWIYPHLLWRVNTPHKEIYLTFDDGPVPGPTEFVLDTLKAFEATATFFCIGENIRKHPEIFKRILQENHAVGNHTFNHLKGWTTSLLHYLENTSLCQAEITNHTTQVTNLFRPPYGRITKRQIEELEKKYKVVMWDVLTSDYNPSLSPDRCLQGSIRASRPGSIVVFHDSIKAERNLRYVLPRFMEIKAKEGYTFQSLANKLIDNRP
jgi:peptidoglycan/xylan/chitin deacetylase (PgdA/CDA1 family)